MYVSIIKNIHMDDIKVSEHKRIKFQEKFPLN